MPKLLVIDDELIIRHSFQKAFVSSSVTVVTAGSVADGKRMIESEQPDVIVVDLQLPDGTGLDVLKWVTEQDPRRPVILITARGTAGTALEAMTQGAFDYMLKPLELDTFTKLVARAFDAARLMKVPAMLPDEPAGDRIMGHTPAIQEMCKLIGRVARQDVNVLIVGESGTGKELVARAIYHHSKRSERPFLAINCAALPENLVESELFGHEMGAFTGAQRQRIGKFEQCDDGTILLDEIGDMPLPAQAKMLRLLQEQQFERVGGNRTLSTKVRILAATNKNLEQQIADGTFRSDLYYRLKVVTIEVPPLRDRIDDIPELANAFLFRYARELGKDVRGFEPEVIERFQQYSWPGNVRELQGVIKDSLIRATGQTLHLDMLPASLRMEERPDAVTANASPSSTSPSRISSESTPTSILERFLAPYFADGSGNIYDRVIETVERELIVKALRLTHGHQANASDRLGINRTTLRNKLRELGIVLDKIVTDRDDVNTDDIH
ncbi:MAG: sigma-54 dependent transcriptional regulator [Gemmataceae bacterium]